MRKCLLPAILSFLLGLLITLTCLAQTGKVQLLDKNQTLSNNLKVYLTTGETAIFNKSAATALLREKPAAVNFIFQFENKTWEIELTKNELFTEGFFVSVSSSPGEKFLYNRNSMLHYRGRIKGKPHSFAAISIQQNNLVAVVADENGNINIGAVNTPAAKQLDQYVIYRESALKTSNAFNCNTAESAGDAVNPVPVYKPADITATTINAEPVDMYFEADYSVFANNGSSIVNTVNYIASLFNVMYTLYENYSVNTKINSLRIWTSQDPFVNLTKTSEVLSAFSATMAKGFPGDLAHFLTQRSIGGGIAYLNALCAGNATKVAVSGNLTNSFSPFPNYSWSVMVIAHETGHNLGSSHTQSCGWPGGPIDNCATVEGNCTPGPPPVNGGTIMSYCHLTGYGINFSNGFGPLPGALIRSRVRDNPCLNPSVYFETTSQTVTEEDADQAGNCGNYKIVSTALKMPYAASQPVNVTLVPAAGTGLTIGLNKDVEISAGDFVLDAGHLSQTITIKVNDDALVENPESLTLNFNLNNNGGNAVKRNLSSFYSLSILSKDYAPDSLTGQQLFYESFDTVSTGLGNWQQTVLYGASSANRWVIGSSNTDFTGNAAYISNDGITNAYSGNSISDSTIVRLESPSINAAAFSSMVVSYLLKCNGEALVKPGGGTVGQGQITGIDYGRVYCSVNNGSSWILIRDNVFERSRKTADEIALPAAANKCSTLKIAFEWLNNSDSVNSPPFIIDSILIKGKTFTPIQSAPDVNNTDDEYIGRLETIHYYNPVTRRVMATVENLDVADAGCTAVSIIATGTGAMIAWDTAAAAKISDKVYQVIPSNTTAPYKLTLYYTKEEVDGWLAETGNTIDDITIVNTAGNMLEQPITTEPVFAATNTLINYGADNDITISGVFNGAGTFALMKSFSPLNCPGSEIIYGSAIKGSAYQWQVNTGSGFVNVSNTAFYAATDTDSLHINTPPTNYYGYKYRCAVTTSTGVVYTPVYALKLVVTWLGNTSKSWEDATNWGCGKVPDENVDVIINGGKIFTPEVSASAAVRSLKINAGAVLTIKTGAMLIIKK